MPNKKPILNDNPFHNFMRVNKQLYPDLEHISRREYYPYAGQLYQKWKLYYLRNYKIKNAKNEIESMYSFFQKQ